MYSSVSDFAQSPSLILNIPDFQNFVLKSYWELRKNKRFLSFFSTRRPCPFRNIGNFDLLMVSLMNNWSRMESTSNKGQTFWWLVWDVGDERWQQNSYYVTTMQKCSPYRGHTSIMEVLTKFDLSAACFRPLLRISMANVHSSYCIQMHKTLNYFSATKLLFQNLSTTKLLHPFQL